MIGDDPVLHEACRAPGRSSIRRLSLADGTVENPGRGRQRRQRDDPRPRREPDGVRTGHARRRAITRVDPTRREVQTVLDGWDGMPFNSPNDVCVRGDGTIWFTDPSYGHLQGFRPAPQIGDYVYRFDPSSGRTVRRRRRIRQAERARVLARRARALRRRQRAGTSTRSTPSTFATGAALAAAPAGHRRRAPDGIKVDRRGPHLRLVDRRGRPSDPDGELAGQIAVPGAVNLSFDGPAGSSSPPTPPSGRPPPPPRSPTAMNLGPPRAVIDEAGRRRGAGGRRGSTHCENGYARVDRRRRRVRSRSSRCGARPGAQVASSRVAVDKARTAAIFIRPSPRARAAGHRRAPRRARPARRARADRRDPADRRRRGRRRDRRERRDDDEDEARRRWRGPPPRSPPPRCASRTQRAPGMAPSGRRRGRRGPRGRAGGQRRGRRRRARVPARGPTRAQVACVGVTTDKARTAAIYRRPSKDFEDQASERPSLGAAPGARRAAAGRHADHLRRPGRGRGRGARARSSAPRTRSWPSSAQGVGRPRCARRRGRSAACRGER